MYSPKFEAHSLGKLSALKEIALVQEMAKFGAPGMGFLYMGFYIYTCAKMRYKGEYAPSYLLDPEEYTWHPMRDCVPLLEKHYYVPFAHPSRARRPMGEPVPEPATNAADDYDYDEEDAEAPAAPPVSSSTLAAVKIGRIASGGVYISSAPESGVLRKKHSKDLIEKTASILGEDLLREIILIL